MRSELDLLERGRQDDGASNPASDDWFLDYDIIATELGGLRETLEGNGMLMLDSGTPRRVEAEHDEEG